MCGGYVLWIEEGEERLPCWVEAYMEGFQEGRGFRLLEELVAEERRSFSSVGC